MATLPTDPAQLLLYVKGHGPTWVSHAAELGLSPGMIAELEAALAATDASWERAFNLRRESEAATAAYYNESKFLYEASSAVVRTIRTNALNTGNDALYPLAQIDAPRPRRALAPAPGQPRDLRWTLGPDGEVTLTWKSKNPRGVANVIYEVTRQVFFPAGHPTPSDTDFHAVGLGGGTRTFTDESIPAGASVVQYQVRPLRGRQKGEASPVLTVRFGAGAQQQSPRLAA